MIIGAFYWLISIVLESPQIPDSEPSQLLKMFQCLREFLFGMAVSKSLISTGLSQAR
jgi:hypothetical protein